MSIEQMVSAMTLSVSYCRLVDPDAVCVQQLARNAITRKPTIG